MKLTLLYFVYLINERRVDLDKMYLHCPELNIKLCSSQHLTPAVAKWNSSGRDSDDVKVLMSRCSFPITLVPDGINDRCTGAWLTIMQFI